MKVASVLAVLGGLFALGAWAAQASAQGLAERTVLMCEAVYMPTRNTWAREVELQGKDGRLSAVYIDGQPVYAFSLNGTTVRTSLDNERIQIDFAERTWRSDFRGLASGQGRCELIGP